MEIITTTGRLQNDPDATVFIRTLRDREEDFGLQNAIIYHDFPTFRDFEDISLSPDILIVSPIHGIIAVKIVLQDDFDIGGEHIIQLDQSLSQFYAVLYSRLISSRSLRLGRRDLSFPISTCFYAPSLVTHEQFDEQLENEHFLFGQIAEKCSPTLDQPIAPEVFEEIRSVIEGAKALSKPRTRNIGNSGEKSYAAILAGLEAEISNFDFQQRGAALSIVNGPQRIRGLAGSGKTIVLAMKAAHIHLNFPEKPILFTFNTKSLYDIIRKLITRFYRHFKDEDPNWDVLHVLHGWGSSRSPGVYSESCLLHGLVATNFLEAKNKSGDPFNYVCGDLLSKTRIKPRYEFTLIDEAQDFPDNFFKLCYELTEGKQDEKSIVWAYDDLQDILDVKMRSPQILFGSDQNNVAYVDLERASEALRGMISNDIVLKKCYRNPREILTCAHSLGFGLYRKTKVQMLENQKHWEDVGYKLETGITQPGHIVSFFRPEENSPLSISNHQSIEQIISWFVADEIDKEIEWARMQIKEFLTGGLAPEDILVIALDDRHAKSYFNKLSFLLVEEGIQVNNVLANTYTNTSFILENKITLSTVYRAKGNEAALIVVLGLDALYPSRNSRSGRNKIFTALTRAKAWVRVSGIGKEAKYFTDELEIAFKHFPYMRFEYPNPADVETIQRDLSTREHRRSMAKQQYLDELKKIGDDDFQEGLFGEENLL